MHIILSRLRLNRYIRNFPSANFFNQRYSSKKLRVHTLKVEELEAIRLVELEEIRKDIERLKEE
jgi:predicted DNA-binding protein (UPF0251 family)